MQCVDLTLPTPVENLALDEALLDHTEAEAGDETLRFWEPAGWFVVVGYGNRLASEVNLAACAADAVPILRRCSGGGTVVQGPGCLNYTLILRAAADTPLAGITETNRYIMERQWAATERVLGRPVHVQGHTDLTLAGRKFSGNAQRRRRRHLLFHGTFLLNLDLARLARWLPMPSHEPAYRQGRSHLDFVTNLGVEAEALKRALQAEWRARPAEKPVPRPSWELLAKYASPAWNGRH